MPSFLIRSIILALLSGFGVGVFLFKIDPESPIIILGFLLLLLIFITNFFSSVYFLIKFRGQKRVWEYKEESHNLFFKRGLFLSLFITLVLGLNVVGEFSYVTVGVLFILIVIGYRFS